MNIMIRNVDAGAVAKIDELAKSKGMSRNAYLKSYLENLSVLGALKELDNKYASIIADVSQVIENNTIMLEKIERRL